MKNLKQRNLKKKAGILLLTAAMTVISFPVFGTEVHAAGLLNNTSFATVNELKAFNTNDNDGAKTLQKSILATGISNGGLREVRMAI